MNDLRTAAQQALEAMDKATRFMSDADYRKLNEAIDALRAALAQQAEPVEPVAWRYKPMIGSSWSLSDDGYYISCKRDKGYIVDSLYTAPPQRLPLTEEEIYRATGHCGVSKYTAINIARAVERAHGIGEQS